MAHCRAGAGAVLVRVRSGGAMNFLGVALVLAGRKTGTIDGQVLIL